MSLDIMADATDKTKKLYELKRQLRFLSGIHGNGTELISVYLPPGSPIHEMGGKLREEAGSASNIKSKSTRNNVIDALEKIIQHLKLYRTTPENGLAVFCGNISDNPAKVTIGLYAMEPPEPVTVSLYRCDSRFFLEPLLRLLAAKDSYGIVVLDGREATLASLKGTNVQILHRLNSMAHAKIRKGGQCLAPDTLVDTEEGLSQLSDLKAGSKIKGADLAEFSIGDWECTDKFLTSAKKAYKIVTHSPRMEIEATAWHRFFTVDEKGVREIYAKDIKVGDRLLVAKKVGFTGKEVPMDYFPQRRLNLSEGEYGKLRKQRALLKWPQAKVAKSLGITQMAVCRMERGEIPLSMKKTIEMYGLYGLGLDAEKYSKPLLSLPPYYTKELAYLLGIIAGDGTLDGNRIIIYESYPELVEKYREVILQAIAVQPVIRKVNKCGQKGSFAKKGYYEVRIYSKEFADFLSAKLHAILARSYDRQIPPQILESGLDVQKAFLSGLYDAEGYMHGKRVDIAMTSKRMMQQVHLVLLRFGIQSSFAPKSAKRAAQWSVSISDSVSRRAFAEKIGFSRADKRAKLDRAAASIPKMQFIGQVPVDGREVFAFAKSIGLKTSDFHAASNFFRNKKPLGREAFRRNIAGVLVRKAAAAGMENAARKLIAKWMSDCVGTARVAEKAEINEERGYVDITVPNSFNFVANGFIVHNSARRFERLIEESIELYYKRVGESMDKYFVTGVKGVIIGGPGPTKENFVKFKPFNYQIKILGVVDTGYTDEYGIRETMAKAAGIIAGQEAVKEKALVDRFMKGVVSGAGLAIYGEPDVRRAIISKQAESIMLSEGLAYKRVEGTCAACAKKWGFTVKADVEGDKFLSEKKCDCEAAGKLQKSEEMDLLDELIALADTASIPVHVVSTDTAEGTQFLQTFYGVGAFLRYR